MLSSSDLEETKPQPRTSLEALKRIHSLLESMNEIRAASTAWQVASGCASLMVRTLDARGVIIHQYDHQTRELRIIGLDGPNPDDLLGSIANVDDDFIASNVLASTETMTVRIDGELPGLAPRRLRALGTSRSVVAVPLMNVGRLVALIEVVDVDERCVQILPDVCTLLSEQLLRVLAPETGAPCG